VGYLDKHGDAVFVSAVEHMCRVVDEQRGRWIEALFLLQCLPEFLAFLRHTERMRAVDAIEMLGHAGHLVFDLKRIFVGIGYHQYSNIVLLHGPQEALRARQVVDTVVLFAVQASNIETQKVTPVVQAVPLELALHFAKFGIQSSAGLIEFDIIVGRISLWNMMQPHEVVKGEVENGAIHIEHQRLATLEGYFGINFHCFILRDLSANRMNG